MRQVLFSILNVCGNQSGLAGSATLTFVYVDNCCSGVSGSEGGATFSRGESVLGSVTVLGCSAG